MLTEIGLLIYGMVYNNTMFGEVRSAGRAARPRLWTAALTKQLRRRWPLAPPGQPIQTNPLNPAIGPTQTILVWIGALYPPCITPLPMVNPPQCTQAQRVLFPPVGRAQAVLCDGLSCTPK